MRDGSIVVLFEGKNHCDPEVGDFVGRIDVNGGQVGSYCVIEVALAFVTAAQSVPGKGVVAVKKDGFFTLSDGVIVETIGGVCLGACKEAIDNQWLESKQSDQDEDKTEGPSCGRSCEPGVGENTFKFFVLWTHNQIGQAITR